MTRAALIVPIAALTIAVAFFSVDLVHSENANAESIRCLALRHVAQHRLRQLEQAEARVNLGRINREVQTLENSNRQLNEDFTHITRTRPPSPLRAATLADIAAAFRGNSEHLTSAHQQWRRAMEQTSPSREAFYDALDRYNEHCDDPPPGCLQYTQPGMQSPVTVGRYRRPSSSTSQVNADVDSLLGQLYTPVAGLPPVLGVVGPGGIVTDYLTGAPIPNPANPGAPLQVEIGGSSPFHNGLIATVHFRQVSVGGPTVTLAQFTGSDGSPISYPADAHNSSVREIPSVRDVFPNGFVVIPTVPSGVALPAIRGAARLGVGGRVIDAFRALQEAFEAAATHLPSLASQLRTPARRAARCGVQVAFEIRSRTVASSSTGLPTLLTPHGPRIMSEPVEPAPTEPAPTPISRSVRIVGSSCTGESGPWTFRAFLPYGTRDGAGISIRWKTSPRNHRWTPATDVTVWVNPLTREQIRDLPPGAMDSITVGSNQLAGQIRGEMDGRWKHRLDDPDHPNQGRLGTIAGETTDDALGQGQGQIRRGCSAEAPPHYVEETITG